MTQKHPAQLIIERWPNRRTLCDDINQRVPESRKIELVAVHRWHQRKSIPGEYDAVILDAASDRNIPLNWRELIDARSVLSDQNGRKGSKSQSDTAENTQAGHA